ncbi:glycoside hydrolase family 2 TIM barrel-domain containing protein [Pseudothermotoga sp.]|uniref:glycoside hydrolase family 2 protein n=1 Tax=Pseudothermotoga sp. TaxID=2033661 RepID=UPI0031F680F2
MRVKINENWNFSIDGKRWRKVHLPHQIELSTQNYPNPISLTGIYERELDLRGFQGKRILLVFHGIDHSATIYINNKRVTEHEGGYDSFKIDVTDQLRFDGTDLLRLIVKDLNVCSNPNLIAGKQDWYGNATGILQDIELWIVEEVYIDYVQVFPKKDLKTVECKVAFSDRKNHALSYTLIDPNGKEILKGETKENHLFLTIPNPKPWNLQSPNLYTLLVRLLENGQDVFQTKFGLRYIETVGDKVLLNGEPIYLFGALDQNFYPDTHYILPKRERILSEFLKIKEMGLNLLRCHVKIPNEIYLDLADELGIMVWIDLPYARKLDSSGKAYLEKLLENTLKRFSNHPSFIMLSLINESWGLDLTENSQQEDREWVKKMYEKAKQLDPTRIYVDNSACPWNYHVVSDIDDYHFYNSFPYHNETWKRRVKDFAKGDYKTFFETPNKKLPKLVSEFGVWGPSDPKTWTGKWMNFPILVMGTKFEDSSPSSAIGKLSKIYNLDDFTYQAQLHQLLGLKFQIEHIRLEQNITGYVITELSDIAWEANGLLDYNRMPKWFYPYLRFLNHEIIPILLNHRSLLLEGEEYKAKIFIANGSTRKLTANLVLRTETKKLYETEINVEPFCVKEIGEISTVLEKSTQNLLVEIFQNGEMLNRNFYPVCVLTPMQPDIPIVWVNNEEFVHKEFTCIHENTKIKEFLDFNGDWISALTLFNVKRNHNLAALLWSLGELTTPYVLIAKNNSFDFESSIITKVLGWGYLFGSLVYSKKRSREVFTTLKECDLAKVLIASIL